MELDDVESAVAEAPTPVDLALAGLETAFEHVVELVGDGGLADLDDQGLVGFAQRFERLRNRHPVIDHQVIHEGDARRLADTLTQRSMTGVLAWALRLSYGEARRRVRAAEQLGAGRTMTGQPLPPRRPALAAAQAAGQASPEQVDVCLRALATVDHRGFDPADVDAADELLAGFTATFAPPRLAELARQVVDRIDPDGTLPKEEVDAERRHFTWRRGRDGMCVGDFRLTPTLGAKLRAVLGPLAAPRNTVVGERTAEDGTTQPVTEVDPRHHGQRLHDALEDACDRLLRSGTLPDSGGTPTTVILTTTLDDLTRSTRTSPSSGSDDADARGSAGSSSRRTRGGAAGGTTSDGTHLGPDAVAELIDEAVCYPTVVDATGVVLWMGRTSRCATPAQTVALIARDGGCSFPGCDHPPEWCERHHVVPWSDGGPTDLDNLTLLCRYHHRQFLARGWTCRMVDRLPTWFPPRWVDPDRKPLRNTRITARHLVC